jgi:ATP-dependent Clp protease protease subunit
MNFLRFLSFWVGGVVLITGPCFESVAESLAEENAPFKEESANPQQDVSSPRLISLNGPVDGAMAIQFRKRILQYDYESHDPIYIWINSPGGDSAAMFLMYNLMKMVESPVVTIGAGMIASAASLLLSAGSKGHRFMFPHSRLMIHEGGSGVTAAPKKIFDAAVEYLKSREDEYPAYLAQETGQTLDKMKKLCSKDRWMGAEEAIALGFIDKVLYKNPFHVSS